MPTFLILKKIQNYKKSCLHDILSVLRLWISGILSFQSLWKIHVYICLRGGLHCGETSSSCVRPEHPDFSPLRAELIQRLLQLQWRREVPLNDDGRKYCLQRREMEMQGYQRSQVLFLTLPQYPPGGGRLPGEQLKVHQEMLNQKENWPQGSWKTQNISFMCHNSIGNGCFSDYWTYSKELLLYFCSA